MRRLSSGRTSTGRRRTRSPAGSAPTPCRGRCPRRSAAGADRRSAGGGRGGGHRPAGWPLALRRRRRDRTAGVKRAAALFGDRGAASWLVVLAGMGVFFAADDQTSVVAVLPKMIGGVGLAQDQFYRAARIGKR